eukprot:TRINITY_DN13325_c0_g1_i1.p1 TRINITY_DN13325_c0_g1~~TRINITY_DN13325_c0_g1_i1.p1  ORF type:complete len:253 (+),score=75.60 TRINITY_DN13325_c0_g1_i1:89-760(+)
MMSACHRRAVLVGNNDPDLGGMQCNPEQTAEDVGGLLVGLDWTEVRVLKQPDDAEFWEAVHWLSQTASGGVALFMFGGHGARGGQLCISPSSSVRLTKVRDMLCKDMTVNVTMHLLACWSGTPFVWAEDSMPPNLMVVAANEEKAHVYKSVCTNVNAYLKRTLKGLASQCPTEQEYMQRLLRYMKGYSLPDDVPLPVYYAGRWHPVTTKLLQPIPTPPFHDEL